MIRLDKPKSSEDVLQMFSNFIISCVDMTYFINRRTMPKVLSERSRTPLYHYGMNRRGFLLK